MTYEELTSEVHPGSVVTFKEYSLDRHEKRHLSVSVDNAAVYDVIQPYEPVPLAKLEQYYGTDLAAQDYQQLAVINDLRLVLSLGINAQGELDIKIIRINPIFFNSGLQTVDITNEVVIGQEPNYLAMNSSAYPISFIEGDYYDEENRTYL